MGGYEIETDKLMEVGRAKSASEKLREREREHKSGETKNRLSNELRMDQN